MRAQASDTSRIAAPPIIHEVLRSPGQPLDPAIRAFMEPRFGYDFFRVRVHSDAAAEQSARDVQARAYAVGHQVVFARGEYPPHTQDGRRLLAHELAHTIQQGASAVGADAPTAPHEPRGRSSRGIARKPLRGHEHEPRLEPEPQTSVLRFTDSGLPLTTEQLVAWALRRYKEGVRLKELFARLASSHEFTGSVDDRANAHTALALELQKETLEQRLATAQREYRLHELARENQAREKAIKHYYEFGPKLRPRRSKLLTLEEAYKAQAVGQASEPTGSLAGNPYWYGQTVARYTVVVPPGWGRIGVFQVDGFFYYCEDDHGVMDDLFYGATAFADTAWEDIKHINVLYGTVLQLTGKVVGFATKNLLGHIASEAFEIVGGGLENEVYESDRRRQGLATKEDPATQEDPLASINMPGPPPLLGVKIPGGRPTSSPQKSLPSGPPPPKQLSAGSVPRIAMGDVKSIDGYNKGIWHVSEMEGRGKYNTNGNIGMALYDRRTGDVYLQVFGLPAGPGQSRKIIYEGPIGRVRIPAGRTPTQIGHEVEESVREVVRRATGQPFPSKSSYAHGPDLRTP